MFKKQPIREKEFQQILLWGPNWIGDVVLSMPAIQALAARYPAARITAVSQKSSQDLFLAHPAVDSVIPIPYSRDDSVFDKIDFARSLKKYDFDLAAVFPNSLRGAWMAFLSGAKTRLGYDAEGRSVLLTHPTALTERIKSLHRAEYFLNILQPLGLESASLEFDEIVPDSARRTVRDRLESLGLREGAFLASIHPGASKPERGWHAQRYGILCQRLVKDYGAKILLLGSAREGPLLDEIESSCPKGEAFRFTDLSLLEAAALIESSHLFIGNDSGMIHLAAMVGTPLVGIYGPGDAQTTGPLTVPKKSAIVTRNFPCSPCRQRFFKECKPSAHNKPYCLEDISVKDVVEEVQNLARKISETPDPGEAPEPIVGE